MLLREDSISRVSSRVAERVITQVAPKALEQFGMKRVNDLALHPPDFLGPLDEGLIQASKILQVIAYAIRTNGEIINSAATPDDVVAAVLEGVSSRLASKAEQPLAQKTQGALQTSFRDEPSLVDLIAVSVLPSLQTEESRLQQLEDALEACVLKVIDRDDKNGVIVSTGFALSDNGYILTAAHVAVSYRDLEVSYRYRSNGDKKEISGEAKVVHLDHSRDFAVLAVTTDKWREFQTAGLRSPLFCIQEPGEMRGLPVLCLGYQEQCIFSDPLGVGAHVARHYPIREVGFKDGHTQECLVLVVSLGKGQVRIVEGISGGPVLNLDTGKVVAMVTGGSRVYDEWIKRWVDPPLGVIRVCGTSERYQGLLRRVLYLGYINIGGTM